MADIQVYTQVGGREIEVTFLIYDHAVAKSQFYSDTGWEVDVLKEPELHFISAKDCDDEDVPLTKDQMTKAIDDAYDYYWEQFSG